jgi:hypothetical protein
MPTKDEMRDFSAIIEKLALEKAISLMDAVVLHCEQIGFEVELAASLLTPPIKAKIGEEAQALNLMKKKVNKLPL